jgi:hypothetical protein
VRSSRDWQGTSGKGKGHPIMMHPMLTSDVAKAQREQLLREAHREQLAAEVLAAHDPREAMDCRRLVTRLVASAHALLRVHGEAVPAERRW